ncbi:hypothetical protein C427_3898 [Paraglaciecola psychrophila 170]|uniref:Uncharacterized protein n=1 Tax=Paraglaciecola psychrophila 170 TaxID=1129794 RepID=K6ZP01_9ALTE|nr:hypothetical protein C427_3898 [Paraglaciecola psychrophila 170]GAC37681.1 hypothetical protein GPSY_2059 [Paraglaciecola psychrophila 170]
MPILGGSATAFPHVKFQPFCAVKTLVVNGIFGLLIFVVDHIYGINMEQL